MATLIYNDRVATFRKMNQLNQVLDTNPSERDILEMASLRVRNLQAFAELQSFNDTGKWLYEHPLTADRSERAQLERLRREDPEQFLQEYSNCCYNVKRYSRFIKDPKRKDRHDSDLKLLREHRRRQDLYKSILQSDEEK
jgi:hypothetical protein